MVSAKGRGEKGKEGRRESKGGQDRRGKWAGGEGASIERPPTLCLRFPSVGKRGAAYTETLIDACTWVFTNINIRCA